MAVNKVIYGGNTLIDLTSDTVDVSHLLYGYKAHNRAGTQITGECTFNCNSNDATASPDEVLSGETYYAGGEKATGQMTNNGAVTGSITTKAQQYTIPQGYHDGSGKVSIAARQQRLIIAGNIKSGVTILGVEGTYTGAAITTQSKTVTPSSSQQIVTADTPTYDYLAQVTVNRIPYTETPNDYGITVTIG